MKKKRVVVLGLDGLDYELFKKYSRITDLRILPMHSPIPVTGPAWTTLYTGDSVITHGIGDVLGRRRPYRVYSKKKFINFFPWSLRKILGVFRIKEPIPVYNTYETTSSHYIWDILSEKSYRVKLFNLPVTFPPHPVNGIHIAGCPLEPNSIYSYPENIMNSLPKDYFQLCDLLQAYWQPLRDGLEGWYSIPRKEGFKNLLAKAKANIRQMLKIFYSLNGSFDFQMLQFSFVDRLGHLFGMKGDIEKGTYNLVNEIVWDVYKNVNYTDFFIISDHGFTNWNHTDTAVFAFKSEAFSSMPNDIQLSYENFAPTILKILGIDYNCDGYSLQDIVINKVRVSSQFNKLNELEEREKIQKQLEELGYFG